MEFFIFLAGLASALAVPLAIIATVQYCANCNRVMDFRKLLIFSWSLAFLCIPFSFGFMVISADLLAAAEGPGLRHLLVSLSYLVFGWTVCSAIYGKPIVPGISSKKIDLP